MAEIAVVTGASRGIGAAIARKLGEKGYHVVVNYNKSEEQARALAEKLGGEAICADVSDAAAVQRLFAAIDTPQALVLNAGIDAIGLFTEMRYEEWRRLFAVNVDGAFHCLQAALPGMISRKSGSIVLISSVWGVHGASCEVAYSATKAALIGLTKALAKELGPSGIRVNCIAPGVIDTEMNSCFSTEDIEALAEDTPLCRIGKAEEVADLAAYLLSEKASFITGQIIGADGGFAG